MTGTLAYQPYPGTLSITSQFYFCGLPLRLDSFSRCQFSCLYCFASSRGGNFHQGRLKVADPNSLRRRLDFIANSEPRSAVDEFLKRRQPVHFGGMSDPFMSVESRLGVTLEILRVLAERGYPTVISTKSNLFSKDEYLSVLKTGNFIIQASIIAANERLLSRIDIGTPGPNKLFDALRVLKSEGIPTTCRIQPLLPKRESDAFEIIDRCVDAGVSHVAVEHLKLPIERSWWGTPRLSEVLEVHLPDYYSSHRAKRVGREWILPPEERLSRVVAIRDYAHSRGLSFGAADNDLLLLSDGQCCCSGVGFFPGFSSFFRFNYPEAVRQSFVDDRITIDKLANAWRPKHSIARYVNSNSRLPPMVSRGAGIADYVRKSWNGSPNGNSPAMLFGIEDTGETDERGFAVYSPSSELKSIMRSGQRKPNSEAEGNRPITPGGN